jgi:hypothetical protein
MSRYSRFTRHALGGKTSLGAGNIELLQHEMARTIRGWLSHGAKVEVLRNLPGYNEWLSYQVREFSMTVMMEANIDRAFRFAVRNHQDELAADIAFDHTGRHVNDQFRQALLLISQIMPFERQPGASYDPTPRTLAAPVRVRL